MRLIYAVLIICLVVSSWTDASAVSLYELIKAGRTQEAADTLSQLSRADTRNGNLLFFQGLLEKNAHQAARLMEASLDAAVAPQYREEIHYLLAEYYFLNENYQRLQQLVDAYQSNWENGAYRKEIKRFHVALLEQQGALDDAIKQCDRYLVEYSEGDANQQGQIDKVRLLFAFNKIVGAQNLLKKLAREKAGVGVSQAIYLLASDAVRRRQTDDAVFYYNLMRDAYPAAVGLDATVDRMETLTPSLDRDSRAERATGTYYSVQVGVFSMKENAQKQAERFKSTGKKVDITTKNISNATYHVVLVGRFSSYEDAALFKEGREKEFNESYQVVAR